MKLLRVVTTALADDGTVVAASKPTSCGGDELGTSRGGFYEHTKFHSSFAIWFCCKLRSQVGVLSAIVPCGPVIHYESKCFRYGAVRLLT